MTDLTMADLVRRVTGRRLLLLWLTFVWVGLWGSVTAANVFGGVAIATLLLLVLPLSDVPSAAVVSPLGVARFVGFFVVDLIKSSAQVVALVLRPRLQLRQAVLAVPVSSASDGLLTLLASTISLTPGTLTVEVDRPRSTLYVHVIDVGDGPEGVEAVRADMLRVERLAILAVGSAACRAALVERSR